MIYSYGRKILDEITMVRERLWYIKDTVRVMAQQVDSLSEKDPTLVDSMGLAERLENLEKIVVDHIRLREK